jgi:XRE family aerobic/anaerobic benzoate catabolism transcriptional regulator
VHSDAEWAFLRQLGKRVRLARVDRELTQEQLAARAGLSRNFVSSVERGAHSLDVLRLRAVAAALERAVADLLPGAAVPSGSVEYVPVRRSA